MGAAEGPSDRRGDKESARAREAVRARLFAQPEQPIRVGRFELVKKIGEGGMGIVFAARDAELDRQVAIKLLHSEDPSRANRLLREAKAMARLTHPNVVTVYEAGTSAGQVYLAMEFVRGQDLRGWLGEADRSWRATLFLLIDAAEGLAAAHKAGLVHRDFKPENVLVTIDGRAKVADFGLARAASSSPTTEEQIDLGLSSGSIETLTRTGAIVGTPAYLPPEALDGAAPDARGDQFSYCVAAYEALFGRRPFAGKTLHELVENVRAGRISAAGQRRAPRRLRRILVRGLAADPDQRHPSMTALVKALEGELTRRRRRVITIATVGAVATMAAAIGWPTPESQCTGAPEVWRQTWSPDKRSVVEKAMLATRAPGAEHAVQRVNEQLDAYGEKWREAHREACMATHARGEQSTKVLDQQMACLDVRRAYVSSFVETLATADRGTVDRAPLAAQRLPEIAACLEDEGAGMAELLPEDAELRLHVLDLRARLSEAIVQAELGQHETAIATFDEVLAAAEEIGYRPLVVDVLVERTQTAPPTPAVRDDLYRAVHEAEAIGYASGQLRAWTQLCRVHAYVGEYEESTRAGVHAQAFLERLGNDPVHRSQVLIHVAFSNIEQSRFDEAVALMEEALHSLEAHDANSPALGKNYESLGTVYTLVERNEDALEAYERAYESMLATYGPNHRHVAAVMMHLGRVAGRLDRFDESNGWYKRSIATFEAVGDENATGAIFALNNMGQNYGDQGQYPEAMAAIEQAIEAMVGKVGAEHRYLVRMRRGLSEVYLDAGEVDKAIAECERALAIAESNFGAEHDETASTRRRLGRILLEGPGDKERALPLFERALAGHSAEGIPAQHKALSQYWVFKAIADDATKRERARKLAREAKGPLAEAPRFAEKVEELERWLHSHPSG